jgi:parvulin-like peptidyl-prolyl isomerase
MNTAIFARMMQSAAVVAIGTTMFYAPVAALAQTPALPHVAQAPARQKAPQAVTAQPAAPQPASTQGNAQGSTQGTATAKTGSGDNVVARVGNTDVSADDLRAYLAALGPREQAAVAKDPALLNQAVQLLLANRLVLQEVIAKKWDQQPGIAAQLDRMRDGALVELYLQSVSAPSANFPSDDELQKVYDANRSAMLVPRQFQLAQIFVALPKDADKATEDKARQSLDDAVRKLKMPGADFTAIAHTVNDAKDVSDLGWVVENQIRPEIRAQVIGLAKDAVSEPIKLDDGWHVLKLIDTKAAYTRTLPEVRDQLVGQMRTERATALRRTYLAELLKQHPPLVNELALSSLLDSTRK